MRRAADIANTMIVEFKTNPFRVRYRLTGSHIDIATSVNRTGHYLDEYVIEPVANDIRRQMSGCIGVPAPFIGENTWVGRVRTMQVGDDVFPLLLAGQVLQALGTEEEWPPDRGEEIPTWNYGF
nr:hypothetical protein [uncultured Dongia sp.]